MPLGALAVAVVLGMVGTALAGPSPVLLACLAGGAAALGMLLFRVAAARWAALAGLAAVLGALRVQAHAAGVGAPSIAELIGPRPVRLEAVVDADVEWRGRHLVALATARRAQIAGRPWRAVAGRVRLSLPATAEVAYGDVVEVYGHVRAASATPARVRDVAAALDFPQLEVRGHEPGSLALETLLRLRQALAAGIRRGLPEPHAALLEATLLGIRTNLPREVVDWFTHTATIHLVVVSGFKVSVIGVLAYTLLRRFAAPGLSLLVALCLIVAYVALSGATPAALRALVMAAMLIMGDYFGRTGLMLNGVLIAAATLALWSPEVLADVGFQLSCLSVAAIAVFGQPLALALQRWLGPLAGTVGGGLAAQAGAMGLAAVYTQFISLSSPLANLLTMPALPLIVGSGALLAVTGSLAPAALPLVSWLAWAPLEFELAVVRWFDSHALAGLATNVGWGIAALYYGALAAVAVIVWWTPRFYLEVRPGPGSQRWRAVEAGLLAGALLASLGLVAWAGRPDGLTHARLLQVPGAAATLVTAGSSVALVNAGADGEVLARALGQHLPFWHHTIDLVALNRLDESHAGGLAELLRRYQVRRVWRPRSGGWAGYAALERTLAEQHIDVPAPAVGQEVALGGAAISLVGETEDGVTLSFLVRSGPTSLLLSGPLAPAQQRHLAATAPPTTALAWPGQPSARLEPELLARANPALLIVSPRPTSPPASLDHLADQVGDLPLYRTDLTGLVHLIFQPGGLSVAW